MDSSYAPVACFDGVDLNRVVREAPQVMSEMGIPIVQYRRRIKLWIEGKKWYQTLVERAGTSAQPAPEKRSRALRQDYTSGQIEGHLLVAWKTQGTRIYTLFEDFIEFYHYRAKIPRHEWDFHEILISNVPRKPYFDIDLKKSDLAEINPAIQLHPVAEWLKVQIIEGVKTLIPNLDIERDVLIYSSHNNEPGHEKASYHIVINNYCLSNHKESQAFYDKAIACIHYLYVKFVDNVYKSTQSFRMLGSAKDGTSRYKILNQSSDSATLSTSTNIVILMWMVVNVISLNWVCPV